MSNNIERFKKACREKGAIAAFLKVIPYMIFLAKNKNLRKKWDPVCLRSGKLEIRGWNTGPKLYWNNEELTKGVGLNTSVFINGRWHDSSKAEWEPIEVSKDSLKIANRWRHLPIKELWTVNMSGNNKIICKIELESERDTEFVEQKFTVMLSERYNQWSNDGGKGIVFPKFKDWTDMKEIKRGSFLITASSNSEKDLPEISVKKIDTPERNFCLQIQNSDYKTRARLLNITASSKGRRLEYKKGVNLFFSTEIIVK